MRRASDAEEGGRRTEGDGQLVVGHLKVLTQNHDLTFMIDVANLTMSKTCVMRLTEDCPDRVRPLRKFEHRGRYLVQVGTKRMEIVFIDNGDPQVLVARPRATSSPPKPPPHDHHVGKVRKVGLVRRQFRGDRDI